MGNNNDQLYYIQGFFLDALTGETIEFSGMIGFYDGWPGFNGKMVDAIGNSKLYDLQVSWDTMEFKKQYADKDTFIKYAFQRNVKRDWWQGQYITSSGATGVSRCLLEEIPAGFFELSPEEILMTRAGQDPAF